MDSGIGSLDTETESDSGSDFSSDESSAEDTDDDFEFYEVIPIEELNECGYVQQCFETYDCDEGILVWQRWTSLKSEKSNS